MSAHALRKIPKAVLIWKLGSNSDKDIITLVPITGPVQRWIDSGFDFLIMPATVVWFAPRYVNESADGSIELQLFSELDPQDEGYVNISIQQVTSVTNSMSSKISSAYLDAVPDELKLPKVI